jgi:transcriptional regulator with XRE-family HTH domain
MKRLGSAMTAADLEAWRDRHDLSLTKGAAALGVSRRQFMKYLRAETEIPETIALLAAAIDQISQKRP